MQTKKQFNKRLTTAIEYDKSVPISATEKLVKEEIEILNDKTELNKLKILCH